MSHLLAISVGPVQGFIAAARRTRDLWFGSYLLSEISRAVAKAVEEQGGNLVFPASSAVNNVANVILAELGGGDPKEVAAMAKEAAQKRWREFADEARGEASAAIRADVWNDQLDDAIEFYAAWAPRSPHYQRDRARVMRLLAGRKHCHDFKQAKLNDAGLPKSSLDGQRATVLAGPKRGESRETYRDDWPKRLRQKLRLSAGEQLDVLGVTKRLGKRTGDSDPGYPSVARVAAETWLRGVRARSEFEGLKNACQKLVAGGLNVVREEPYRCFPYEGTVIYKDRHADLKRELRLGQSDLDDVAAALADIGGKPLPYLAVLVADGDNLGAAISRLDSPAKHREFSLALAGFAEVAGRITAAHGGVLVYAGGDDVLAFLPVDKCLDCARELHDTFAELLRAYGSPTLSVGLAVAHFMENLEDLRQFGRQAERSAKAEQGKDALAVHLHKRGGAPIEVCGRWESNVDARLRKFADLINEGTIPGKLAYELRSMATLYAGWPPERADRAIQLDLIRLIAKKQSKGAPSTIEAGARQALRPFLQEMNAVKLLDFARELLVARLLAAALRQSEGHPARTRESAS